MAVLPRSFPCPLQVVYHPDANLVSKVKEAGTQVAAGVPFMLGEDTAVRTFRVGLFGLDKLKAPVKTIQILRTALSGALPDVIDYDDSDEVSYSP